MRLIETTCELIDKKLFELDINQEGVPVPVSFDIESIESFRPSTSDSSDIEIEEGKTLLMFKSGDSLVIGMGYNELKQFIKDKY